MLQVLINCGSAVYVDINSSLDVFNAIMTDELIGDKDYIPVTYPDGMKGYIKKSDVVSYGEASQENDRYY